jgi:hypothetical protein
VREEEDVVQGHIRQVGNIYYTDLRAVLALFTNRKDQVAATRACKLVRDNRHDLVTCQKVLTATISPGLDN